MASTGASGNTTPASSVSGTRPVATLEAECRRAASDCPARCRSRSSSAISMAAIAMGVRHRLPCRSREQVERATGPLGRVTGAVQRRALTEPGPPAGIDQFDDGEFVLFGRMRVMRRRQLIACGQRQQANDARHGPHHVVGEQVSVVHLREGRPSRPWVDPPGNTPGRSMSWVEVPNHDGSCHVDLDRSTTVTGGIDPAEGVAGARVWPTPGRGGRSGPSVARRDRACTGAARRARHLWRCRRAARAEWCRRDDTCGSPPSSCSRWR